MNHTDKEEITTEEIDMAVKNLPETTTPGWEERLTSLLHERMFGKRNDYTSLRDFIRAEIEASYECGQDNTIIQSDEATISHWYKKGRLDVIKELEGKLPEVQDHTWQEGRVGEQTGFNYYRTTVLNIIKSIKGE